ncbi:LysR family transcriptional regulator [uncultured Faecalibaculum sp.]|uniref:LysR family transcriptional regulator n=2 Tax=uncultured Faecalibaculum sp. TaxID=1729681 RepID=UPI0025E2C082|nr:LysR family transcriptional regulator [uncultured Faecalibaculum sp.]
MDLSKIRYYFKAAELQNVTQAAKACHLAQTSMSKYLSNLKRETGVLLLDRKKNRLILNESGSRFYQEMKKIDGTYRNLCQLLQQNRTSRLNLGVVTSDYSEFDLIEGFERTPEGIQVFCQEDETVFRLQQKVVDGSCLPPSAVCRMAAFRFHLSSSRSLPIPGALRLQQQSAIPSAVSSRRMAGQSFPFFTTCCPSC